jgi:glutamyl-tRNA reductase
MLTLIGASHHEADLDVRERVAVAGDEVPALVAALRERFGPSAVLSTCNRMEVYLAGEHGRDAVIDFLGEHGGIDVALARSTLVERRDIEAVRHLFGVAAGIDSMVLGEPEILGQVRGAYSLAIAEGAEDALLSRLFHSAIRVGRRARAETGIGRHALSVSSIAVHEAVALHADLASARVLVLGAGDAGRAAVEALVDRGVASVTVVNRTLERAEALAADLGGRAEPFDRLLEAMAASDIVIAASGSPEHLVQLDQTTEVLRARNERLAEGPLLVVDIAVPRDVDPAVRDLPGVVYRDLDDLRAISERNGAARGAEVERVQAIVDAEAQRLAEWWALLEVVPTIAALTERAEAVRRTQLEKALRVLRPSEEVRGHLDALTRAVVSQLLHDPITTLRQRGDRDAYVSAVRTLFRLDEDSAATALLEADVDLED